MLKVSRLVQPALTLLRGPGSRSLFWGRRTWDPFQDMRSIVREMEHQFENLNQSVYKALPSSVKGDMALPMVAQEGDRNKYRLMLDLSNFKPEDVKVSLVDRQLKIKAKSEQTTGDGCRVYHEVQREYLLPENLNFNELKSIITDDGFLSIEAPLPEPPKPKEIPITRESKQVEGETSKTGEQGTQATS